MNPNEPDAPEQPVDEATRIRRAGHSRRAFLFKLSLALNGIVGAVMAVPIIGYLFGPATGKKSADEAWVDLGPLSGFPEGETRLANFRNPITTAWDGQTADIPCWVRRVSGNSFQVFAINCAHLGCPVRWFAESKLFMCPCHGGAYYQDGSRASGPPERGLFEYEHKIAGDKLLISAGKMPTLAAKCAPASALTQIAMATPTEISISEMPGPETLKPESSRQRCGSCQG